MKRLSMFFLLVVFISLSCNKKSVPIQGAWQMVYQEFSNPDTTVINTIKDFPNPQVKIFTKAYFSFGYHDTTGDFFGGGKYKINGNEYIETAQYAFNKGYIGQPVRYNVRIVNDTLFQSGIIDTTNKTNLLEKYIRLD